MNWLELLLGVMTALGGFIDIGELVFAGQAGAHFGVATLWVLALGTLGIIVYSEMAGRVAAVEKKAVFDLVRERLPRPLAILTLVTSSAVNLITCAAEIGGVGILLRSLLGVPYHEALLLSTLAIFAAIWLLPFKWIERVFGLAGLLMLVFAAATFATRPDWRHVATGLVPQVARAPDAGLLVYAYFAVGLFSAVMMAYEVYFYSSGGIEDHWTKKDTPMNAIVATVGLTLGSLVAACLIVIASRLFQPRGLVPDSLDVMALAPAIPFGRTGLRLALLGMLAAIAGAAVETAMAGAYDYAQFFRLPWGRHKPPKQVPQFTGAWMAMLGGGLFLMLLGLDPLKLVEYAVVFSAVVLPFTYWPILRVAADRQGMGSHANHRVINVLGWVFLALLTIAAIAAPVLLFVTHAGAG